MKRWSTPNPADLVALALYVGLTSVLLWPLLGQLTTRLPMGTEDVRTVPLFNQWTIWWNADRLSHGLTGYWNAPIFYPDTNTFAYSEPQPWTMWLAPVVWWGSATLAYNVYLAISLLLNGWFTHLILRWFQFGWLATYAGAMLVIALPIVHWQLGVVQLVPLWGILWTIWALAKLQACAGDNDVDIDRVHIDKVPSYQLYLHGLELGTALAVTSWMAIYHALFLTTLMVPAVLIIGKRLLKMHMLGGLLIGAVVCLLLTAPMIQPMWMLSRNQEFVRPSDIIDKLSLLPRDYFSVYGYTPLSDLYVEPDRYWRVSPGWLKIALAGIGVSVGLSWRPARRWTVLLLVIALAAFVLSFGSHLQLGSVNLWQLMTSTLPGFKQVRSPFRYAYFVHLIIAIGAAGGIQALWAYSARFSGPRLKIVSGVTITVLALAALTDPLPGTLKLGVVPDLRAANDWCSALHRAYTAQPGAALCLPMAGGDEARDFEQTCIWMTYATQHEVPLVNGYSGFCPQRVLDLGTETSDQPITKDRLLQLYDQGLRYLIVHRGLYRCPWKAGEHVAHIELELVVASDSGIDVYWLKQH